VTTTLDTAASEVARLRVEVATVEDAGTDPLEINIARTALEMAERRLADAEAVDEQRQKQEQAELVDTLLNGVWPAVDAEDEHVWHCLQVLKDAADELHQAHERRRQVASFAIGTITNSVQPDSTPRYTNAAGVPVVDGRRLTGIGPALSTSVASIVADLVAPGLPGIASELRTAGRVGNSLRPPHQKALTA
jgi:hypothetical protein